MTDRKYFSGNSLEQAVMNAARHFKIDPDDLDYRQLDKRHGFVKVRRSHLIEVDPNSPRKPLSDDEAYKRAMNLDPEAQMLRDPNDRSHRGSRGRGRGRAQDRRGGRADEQADGRSGRGGRRRRSRGRRSQPRQEAQPSQQQRSPSGDEARQGQRSNGRSRQEQPDSRQVRQEKQDSRQAQQDSRQVRQERPDSPQARQEQGSGNGRAASTKEQSDQRRRVMKAAGRGGRRVAEGPAADVALSGSVSLLRLASLDLEAVAYAGEDHLLIELSGADEERVTQERGEVLAALQQLVPSIVRSQTGEQVFCRVDCDGFREVHDERLRDLAQRVAGKVDRSRRAQVLESMNPAERRIIHMTLNDDPAVSTESLGRGYFKRVRISPE